MGIEQEPAQTGEPLAGAPPAQNHWFNKVAALVYVFFCFELGVVLLLYPWLSFWDRNFFSGLSPEWYELWTSPYMRGAVSGIGVINIWISFSELFRLRRFSKE